MPVLLLFSAILGHFQPRARDSSCNSYLNDIPVGIDLRLRIIEGLDMYSRLTYIV